MHIKQNQQACNDPWEELESKVRVSNQPKYEESNKNVCKPDFLPHLRILRSPGFFFIQGTLPEVTIFLFHEEIKPQNENINNYAPEKLADIKGIKEDSCEKDTHKQQVYLFFFSKLRNLDSTLPPNLDLILISFICSHYLPFPCVLRIRSKTPLILTLFATTP